MNPDSLLDAITRKDAVVFVPDPRDRRTAKGVRRVLTVSSAGLEPTSGMPPAKRMYAAWVLERRMRNVYLDLARMEDELEFSDTDWTVVRAAPSDRPAAGAYRVSAAGSGGARHVSRQAVANYLLAHLADWETYQRKLLISSNGNGRGGAGT
jgi:hypothetical protein